MNTTVEPTTTITTAREPIWRVVGGSLAAGLVGSLVLTLGVFGGASEPVITGSAMLAFAGGWALLAHLSRRFTSRPQTWARVPAVAMAVVGLALIVVQPGDRALDGAGWVWPLPMLALTVWMVAQMRRNLTGRARWLMYPIFAGLALVSAGGMFNTVAARGDRAEFPPRGELYNVGGHRLHIDCIGTGEPTVVLFNGLGGTTSMWARVVDEVSATTRVCAYDRAGQGWSDDVDSPQDGVAVADDLHTLLQAAGETGPFVLAGHSAGGAYAMVYADRYPNDVAGMVLLDSMSPYQFTAIPSFEGEYQLLRRVVALMPSLARVGFGIASPRGYRSMRDEQSTYPTMLEQAQSLTSIDGKPLIVVTASKQAKTDGWADAQQAMLALSSNNQHRFADTTHEGAIDHPESIAAILTVTAQL